MYGSPLLSTLPSPKTAAAIADQQAADLLSVDELLDNPWHYDCVVSPRLQASDLSPSSTKSPTSPPSLCSRSAPSPAAAHCTRPLSLSSPSPSPDHRPPTPSSDRPHSPPPSSSPPRHRPPSLLRPAAISSPPPPSLSKAEKLDRSLTVQTTRSNYVSLASFIDNADKSSYGSSAAATGLDLLSKRSMRTSIKPVLSKCRDRDAKTHIRGDPSRIRSYSGCLAVD